MRARERRRFRRTVAIDDPRARQRRQRALDVGYGKRLTSNQEIPEAGQRLGPVVDHGIEERSRQPHDGDVMGSDETFERG